MNRFDSRSGGRVQDDSRGAKIEATEARFRLIRRVKARVRSEQARGWTTDQILRNTQGIQECECSAELRRVIEDSRERTAIALRATRDALSETPEPIAAPSFDRWLAETIRANRPLIPMKVVPAGAPRIR